MMDDNEIDSVMMLMLNAQLRVEKAVLDELDRMPETDIELHASLILMTTARILALQKEFDSYAKKH